MKLSKKNFFKKTVFLYFGLLKNLLKTVYIYSTHEKGRDSANKSAEFSQLVSAMIYVCKYRHVSLI